MASMFKFIQTCPDAAKAKVMAEMQEVKGGNTALIQELAANRDAKFT